MEGVGSHDPHETCHTQCGSGLASDGVEAKVGFEGRELYSSRLIRNQSSFLCRNFLWGLKRNEARVQVLGSMWRRGPERRGGGNFEVGTFQLLVHFMPFSSLVFSRSQDLSKLPTTLLPSSFSSDTISPHNYPPLITPNFCPSQGPWRFLTLHSS